MDLKEYCGKAADVLRSSERMMQRNVEIWKQQPDEPYYDPAWDVHIEQDEVAGLIRNLTQAADLFEILSKNSDAAADLLAVHMATEGGDV